MTNYLNRAHQRMPNLGLRKGGGLQGHLLSNRWGEQFMTNYLNRAHQRMPRLGLRKGGSLQGQLLGNLGKSLGLNHTLLQCGGANNSCHITSTHSGRSTGGCKSDLSQGSPFGLREGPLGCAKAEACSTSRAAFAASRASSASRSA